MSSTFTCPAAGVVSLSKAGVVACTTASPSPPAAAAPTPHPPVCVEDTLLVGTDVFQLAANQTAGNQTIVATLLPPANYSL
jgi:hypothetical protein